MSNYENNNENLRWLYLALNLIAWLFLIASIISNAFVNLANPYQYMDVQPADFCFYAIWAVLYMCQVAFLIYGMVYLFRKDPEKTLIFKKVNHLHFVCYILATISYMANISWSWSCQYSIGNFITLVFMAWPQWTIVVLSMVSLKKRLEKMKEYDMRPDVVVTRMFIQNGCAVFATWSTIGVIMGFANLLTNKSGVDGVVTSTIAISLILALTLIYFVVDMFVVAQSCLFQYTPYLTVVWLFVGILAKNLATSVGLTRNNIISIIALSITLALLFIKLVIPLLCFDKIKPSTRPPTQSRAVSKTTRRELTQVSIRSREKTGVWRY